ncbi:MAG TPA: hypothetical protein VK468_03745 [Pyrinomonadaceae bacterium]|nr:hypothetical protein [Pyrinomonadaceae bacterium]
MRVRTSLILADDLLAKIDEIAGEKQRRSLVVETALREFIAREEKKRPKVVAVEEPVVAGRPGAPKSPPVRASGAKPAVVEKAVARKR